MDGTLLCSWPGCAKTTAFKTQKLLETHLENIHINPLICTQPHCPYNIPFPRKGDFDRHLASKHGIGRLFRCPDSHCRWHNRPFGRKDKFRQHMSKYSHGTFHCQFDHCEHKTKGLWTKEDLANHEQAHHTDVGTTECAIGNCEGSNSRFTKYDWEAHLRWQHWIGGFPLENLQKQGKTTVTLADVTGLNQDCYLFGSRTARLDCIWCKHSRKHTI